MKASLEAKAHAKASPVIAPTGTTPVALAYKVGGRMFALLSVRGDEYVVLKCDPHLAEMLRAKYSGIGHRTHLDRRHWIAVDLTSDVPLTETKRLVVHSYDLVFAGLTRGQRASLGLG